MSTEKTPIAEDEVPSSTSLPKNEGPASEKKEAPKLMVNVIGSCKTPNGDYCVFSPTDSQKLGVKEGDAVLVKVEENSIGVFMVGRPYTAEEDQLADGSSRANRIPGGVSVEVQRVDPGKETPPIEYEIVFREQNVTVAKGKPALTLPSGMGKVLGFQPLQPKEEGAVPSPTVLKGETRMVHYDGKRVEMYIRPAGSKLEIYPRGAEALGLNKLGLGQTDEKLRLQRIDVRIDEKGEIHLG